MTVDRLIYTNAKLRSSMLPSLTSLDISDTPLSGMQDLLYEIFQCCSMGLKYLYVNGTDMALEGITALVAVEWPALESLDLAAISMNADALQVLASAKWPVLQHLNLLCNDLDERALLHVQAGPWPVLHTLDLRACIKDDSTQIERWHFANDLAKGSMPCLTNLDISNNMLTDANLIRDPLLSGNWPRLQSLDLSCNLFGCVSIELFGINGNIILDENVHDFGCRFAGEFAYGRWPVLDTVNLQYSSLQ